MSFRQAIHRLRAEELKIDGEWHRSPGASDDALAALRVVVPQVLPDEYYQLLSFSNGGEGPLPVGPFNFVLDSAEVTAYPKQVLFYEQIAPDMFVFGSNGADELVAFDLRGNSPPWPIVCFDGIAPEESVERIADSLAGFVSLIGKA